MACWKIHRDLFNSDANTPALMFWGIESLKCADFSVFMVISTNSYIPLLYLAICPLCHKPASGLQTCQNTSSSVITEATLTQISTAVSLDVGVVDNNLELLIIEPSSKFPLGSLYSLMCEYS